jgi:hypothetical protein
MYVGGVAWRCGAVWCGAAFRFWNNELFYPLMPGVDRRLDADADRDADGDDRAVCCSGWWIHVMFWNRSAFGGGGGGGTRKLCRPWS